MNKWKWHLNEDKGKGIVNATIYSEDGQTKLNLTNVPGGLVDKVTDMLDSSYQWGHSDGASTVSTVSEEVSEVVEVEEEDVEIEDLDSAKKKIANLKGQITKLKKQSEKLRKRLEHQVG